jgi:hypothetical protein
MTSEILNFIHSPIFLVNRHEDGKLVYIYSTHDIIHLLYVGEGNMKMYSAKSIIFPEGNALGKYDTHG